jgi:hypothetical protein
MKPLIYPLQVLTTNLWSKERKIFSIYAVISEVKVPSMKYRQYAKGVCCTVRDGI